MYWLLSASKQAEVRAVVNQLTTELANITSNLQTHQLFPYVGRKDFQKAVSIISNLTNENNIVCDPFSGSGIHSYAAASLNRQICANEWEVYANRLSFAPWRIPDNDELIEKYQTLIRTIKPRLDYLYKTKCTCDYDHVLHSMFYDREPLTYINVTPHERLGPNGETIIYRGRYSCPNCGAVVKFFDQSDNDHLRNLENEAVDDFFNYALIENSRINLSTQYLTYGSLFPHRSKLALRYMWEKIDQINANISIKMFFEDVFLSILPQSKFKDYRSKSQDLHCPPITLRETNLLHAFQEQFEIRNFRLRNYSFSRITSNDFSNPIQCRDYRIFLNSIENNSIDLVLTDPPWTDGTAFFERAQLYHPWLNYDLKNDAARLENEMVVTDAPSRKEIHNKDRWWSDVEEFFTECYRVLRNGHYLALYFRPIPAAKWLENLNRLKLVARKAGFEPLLSIDVASSDPSMRIQQSASYVFSKDVVILFLKLESEIRRDYFQDYDLDQLVFQTSEGLQETNRGPFTFREWRQSFSDRLLQNGISLLDSPREESRFFKLFQRYNDQISPSLYLPKSQTPFSDQLFDTPVIERLFTFVPVIIETLTRNGRHFTYDEFLLALAEYVENGTRQLISRIERVNIRQLIETYAEPLEDGSSFRKRPLPTLPHGLAHVLELEAYEFEAFVARLLVSQGFTSVVLLGRTGDRGVDVSGIDPQGRSTVVQCKRFRTNNVSASPIQRLHSFAITRNAQRKILITTSDFTPQAIEEAENTGTELINGQQLENIIAHYLPDLFT